MKKLNLVNWPFSLHLILIMPEIDGKVSLILLEGDRVDPINLLYFAGELSSLIKTLDPSMTDDDITKESLSLGVMRGCADPTIGEPKNDILSFAAIECNNQKFSVSSKIGCAFSPRF